MEDYYYQTNRRKELEEIAVSCLREETVMPYITESEDEIHNVHDKGYKYLFSVKKNFIDFVKTFMKVQLNVELTEENITMLDKEFITKEFSKQESDVIYEVKSENKIVYFVLIELQRKVDRKMPYRILNYIVEIWRKWEKNRKKDERFILPKIIPCVIYNGKNKWTAPIELKELYDEVEEKEDYLVNFKYILIDINRYKREDLLKIGNMISSAFYLDTVNKENMEKELKNLSKAIKKLNDEELKIFLEWIKNVLTISKEEKEKVEKIMIKEERNMHNFAILVEEMFTEKKMEGRAEGKVEGRSETIKRMISYKLKIYLSPSQLELIDNATEESLNEMEQKIFEITSWEEVEEIIKEKAPNN